MGAVPQPSSPEAEVAVVAQGTETVSTSRSGVGVSTIKNDALKNPSFENIKKFWYNNNVRLISGNKPLTAQAVDMA